MDRRRNDRSKKRMGCTLWVEGARFSGIVLDMSASGLFVQSSANVVPGTPVQIELNGLPGKDSIVLQAHVARRKVVPARLKSVAQGGVGVRIAQAPEAYYALLAKVQRLDDEPPGKEPTATKGGKADREKQAPQGASAGAVKREKTGLEKKALAAALRRSLGVEIGDLPDRKRGDTDRETPPPKKPEGAKRRPKPARPGSSLKRKALAAALRSSLGVDIDDEDARGK
jgi:hypothetical protein